MKYDNIIIGGGLSGLIAGVKLAEAGKSTAIITSGQSALHFSSGALSLLNCVDGKRVDNPLEAISRLPQSHPYSKIGVDRIPALADEAVSLLNRAGIKTEGCVSRYRYRLTPLGMWEPTWLSVEDLAACENPGMCPWHTVAVVNFHGYLDFYPQYLADGLHRLGFEAKCHEIALPQLSHLRQSCSEMRAASIAKVLRGDAIDSLAFEINKIAGQADVILIPAVIGINSTADTKRLIGLVDKPLRYVPVIPMSVIGVRAEFLLRRLFERLGGTYLLGDSVKRGIFNDNRLTAVVTANLGDTELAADNFIISTGSFFSRGLVAKPDTIAEPVFGLDIDSTADRTSRYNKNFFGDQPYMRFGVSTDNDFRVSIDNKTIVNLRAIGSILSGADSLKEGSGAGIAILTALEAAQRIIESGK